MINAHGNLKIFLGPVIRWYEHACRNSMSFLKQEIADLKSGKCVEHARAAAARQERAMCRGS